MFIAGITDSVHVYDQAPDQLKDNEYLWIHCSRQKFEETLPQIQEVLTRLDGQSLLNLHIKDLLSTQISSTYDYTSAYDVVMFKHPSSVLTTDAVDTTTQTPQTTQAPSIPEIHSDSVGFIVYNRILLCVSDEQNPLMEQTKTKLLESKSPLVGRVRNVMPHTPSNPDELLLHIIDALHGSYTQLRLDLSQKLDYWQTALLSAEINMSTTNWNTLFKTRNTLYYLDDLYEDQSDTIRAWQDSIDSMESQLQPQSMELLKVRSRDVIEHIERARTYINRLQSSLDSAMQIHFSITSNYTNQVMRVLTVLTAIFLPLNLLTGLFGMNFEGMFLTQYSWGFWLVVAIMAGNTVFLVRYFGRKKYLK